MKFMKINEISWFHDISYQNHKETDDLNSEKHRKSQDFHDFDDFSVSFAIFDVEQIIRNSIKFKNNEKWRNSCFYMKFMIFAYFGQIWGILPKMVNFMKSEISN